MRMKELINSFRNRNDPDEITWEDGRTYVKRYESIRLGPIDTGLAGKQRWFPVAELDTDHLVMEAAFGGWLGLHRFSQGEIGTGLLYILTCGCVGILPAMDILQYICGSMCLYMVDYTGEGNLIRQKEKMYLRKPVHTARAIICLFISVAVGVLAWKLLYQGLGGYLLTHILSASNGAGAEAAKSLSETFRLMTDGLSWKGGW